jgi:nicotinate-nucleotide adenylyltransferase
MPSDRHSFTTSNNWMNLFSQSQDQPLRLGLYGGTFNPIHRGHTQVAKDVLQHFRLTHIHFLPSALPPHKQRGEIASAADRCEMARMAVAGESALSVSDVEFRRSGPSYTIDTLRHFRAAGAQGLRLFFLIGLDAFLEIHTWMSYGDMFELAAFIVMARPRSLEPASTWQTTVIDYTRQWIGRDYALGSAGDALIHPQKKPIYFAMVTPMPISSSQIREMIRQGRSIKEWVAPPVAAYIESKGLYR